MHWAIVLIIYIQMYVSIETYLYMIYQLLLFDTMVPLKTDTPKTIQKKQTIVIVYTFQAKTQNI